MTIPLSKQADAGAAALALNIDRRQNEPIAQQLGRQLRQMILSGRMQRLARLPSSRALAIDLGVSRATVVLAYEQLVSEGYLEGRHGAGMFVSSALPAHALQPSAPRPPSTRNEIPRRAPASAPANAPDARTRPFQLGAIDPSLFPFKEWARLLQRAWRTPPRELLAHTDPFGWPALRTAISQHLLQWRGIDCDPTRIAVTSGTADAIELIAQVAFKPGSNVLIEEPGYPSLRYALQRLGIDTTPVPVDRDGFDPLRIPRHNRSGGAIVTPSRQFPLGATLPLARRLALLEWAISTGGIIVEDDFDSEYRYEGTPLPALAGLDTNDRVIYIGSFSKVLLPTLRLGFVVMPNRYMDSARSHLRQRGAMASLVAQPALAEFMASGAYATHIRRTRRVYARRMATLLADQGRFDGLLLLNPSSAGLHVVADLSPGLAARFSDREVSRALGTAGVNAVPLSDYFAGPAGRQGLLLGFSGYPEPEIIKASRKIGTTLGQMMRAT